MTRSWWRLFSLNAVVLYLPFSWLLWLDGPWGDYRRQWALSWPVLPGLPSLPLTRSVHETRGTELLGMGVMTLLLLIVPTTLMARGSRTQAILVFVLLCAYSTWMALASHAIYHA